MGKKGSEFVGDYRGKDEKSKGFDGKGENVEEKRVRLVVKWGGEDASRERKGRRAVLVDDSGERRREEKGDRVATAAA